MELHSIAERAKGARQDVEIFELPDRGQLLQKLKCLLEDEQALARAASCSYRHQLGFEKYVLEVLPSGACLRLHYWDALQVIEEDIHSHCAGFSSTVLIGQLTEQQFELLPGDTHLKFLYRFDSLRGESVANLAGSTTIKMGNSNVLTAGDSYTVEANALHRVTSVQVGTVTVSSWSPRAHDAVVLKPTGNSAEPCCARAGMDPKFLKFRLQEVYERILER